LGSGIDRNSPLPYYAQVKELIHERIRKGDWKTGEQLPGEPELCRIFEVSRTVIRQALDSLMREGVIVRIKGRGTFVAEPKISEGLVQTLTGFYEDMMRQGYVPVSKVLKQEVVPASSKIARYLETNEGTPVIEICRLRYVQEIPLALVTTYVPQALCPSVLYADLTRQSLYTYLEKTCELRIARGRRIIEAVLANQYEAQLLEIPRDSPLILLDSVSYLEDDTPIEYYHALHRSDRARFEVELVRVRDHSNH
jgi:GntR family transcriptional regulator